MLRVLESDLEVAPCSVACRPACRSAHRTGPAASARPTRLMALLLTGLAVLALLLPLAAAAHKPSDAYLQLRVQGAEVQERLDLALRDLDRELAIDADADGQISWGEVRGRWSAIRALAAEGLTVQADGQPCTAVPTGEPSLDRHSDGTYAVLERRWTCAGPVGTLGVGYRVFLGTDPTHRGVLRVDGAAGLSTAVLVPGAAVTALEVGGPAGAVAGHPSAGGSAAKGAATTPTAATDGAASNAWSGFGGFVAQGVHHILIGIDHILFLVALLLPMVLLHRPGQQPAWVGAPAAPAVLREVLWVVSSFTLAHSITLAVATLGWVDPSPRWVESLIAASVVVAALDNLRPFLGRRRVPVTFVFGLVHGFGFASVLRDLDLGGGALAAPLLGFNLGVELGQLALVAVFLPLAWAARRTGAYVRGVLQGGSVLIALLALVWLIERVADVQLLGLGG